MKCIESKKGDVCSACGKVFKAGTLIWEHSLGKMCAENCGLTKDLGDRRCKPSKHDPFPVRIKKYQKMFDEGEWGCDDDFIVEPDEGELVDVMGGKLKADINKIGAKK